MRRRGAGAVVSQLCVFGEMVTTKKDAELLTDYTILEKVDTQRRKLPEESIVIVVERCSREWCKCL